MLKNNKCPAIYSICDEKQTDTTRQVILSGQVFNIFHETVDSVMVKVIVNDNLYLTFSDYNGLYNLRLPASNEISNSNISINFYRNDYNPFDTTFIFRNRESVSEVNVILSPKFKILLKGRIFVANSPLEGVDVSIKHLNEVHHLQTLGCYYDDEDYWNCLYLGMFKTEIVTENPNDSVYLSFSKYGYKPQSHKFKFAEYSGDLLKYKMKYADSIPDLPNNNFNVKLAYQFDKQSGWFLGLSYYRHLSLDNFNRFALGIEFSMLTIKNSYTLQTLPNSPSATFDTTYISLFAGPSFLLFLTKPHIRKFSTYVGSIASYSFNEKELIFQPFLGTRFFMDLRKSFSIEFRYLMYHMEVKEYTFNFLGSAVSNTETVLDNKFLINIGIQINF